MQLQPGQKVFIPAGADGIGTFKSRAHRQAWQPYRLSAVYEYTNNI